jgi:hypothetical protein
MDYYQLYTFTTTSKKVTFPGRTIDEALCKAKLYYSNITEVTLAQQCMCAIKQSTNIRKSSYLICDVCAGYI